MAKIQLGVIFGSRSCEHEVSIISGVQLARAANREKYDIWPIYIAKDGRWYTGEKLLDIHTYTPFDPYAKGVTRVTLDMTAGSGALISYQQEKGLFAKGVMPVTVAKLDCVIPVMHGLHGEDGTLQGLLELANIPYASTGVAGSAVGMDKIMMKQVFRGMGFPVLPDLFASSGAAFVHCGHFEDNEPSRKLLGKLGFREFSGHTAGDRLMVDEILFR